ncbi:asparaginase [Maribrevibacterium harenarium]|uniref:Asparaginase n=1 Tax=Maribrevibacterium harenarium TaxID=2589817 RepID=A0A501X029_9GAMM|nr:asparaginase [Maribrevibacterium harenarium]TPE54145.1 asparaginase [Maribrevibacterium harenarium]
MSLLILYTGGTIGMMPTEQGLAPSRELVPFLQTLLARELPAQQFDVLCCEHLIDSSNAAPSDWCAIARILEQSWHHYTGFVILHGTDTMAYTAAALHTWFNHHHKPIVVTGSQIPFSQTPSDAQSNLLGAIKAATHPFAGVHLFFDRLLISGDRAHKCHTNDWRAFMSVNEPVRAELLDNGLWQQTHLPAPKARLPVAIPGHIRNDVVTLLPVFPGVTASHWQGLLGEQVKGAILLSYGAGNIPDQNQALVDLIKSAIGRGVVMINITQCQNGAVNSTTYAAGAELIKAGVISGKDMTYEAAFARLTLMLGAGWSAQDIRAEW